MASVSAVSFQSSRTRTRSGRSGMASGAFGGRKEFEPSDLLAVHSRKSLRQLGAGVIVPVAALSCQQLGRDLIENAGSLNLVLHFSFRLFLDFCLLVVIESGCPVEVLSG